MLTTRPKIAQRRENAKIYLENNPEIRDEVEKQVREHYGLVPAAEADDKAAKGKTAGKDKNAEKDA